MLGLACSFICYATPKVNTKAASLDCLRRSVMQGCAQECDRLQQHSDVQYNIPLGNAKTHENLEKSATTRMFLHIAADSPASSLNYLLKSINILEFLFIFFQAN